MITYPITYHILCLIKYEIRYIIDIFYLSLLHINLIVSRDGNGPGFFGYPPRP